MGRSLVLKSNQTVQTFTVKHVIPIKIIKVLMRRHRQDRGNQIKGAKDVNSLLLGKMRNIFFTDCRPLKKRDK